VPEAEPLKELEPARSQELEPARRPGGPARRRLCHLFHRAVVAEHHREAGPGGREKERLSV